MKVKFPLLFVIVLVLINSACKKEISTIAFYNVENLFDTLDDPHTNDNEFLPNSEKEWNTVKYQNKLDSLSKVIAMIGDNDGPEILGMCEMENRSVLEDLVMSSRLQPLAYKIAHIESKDYRGIDVALLYKAKYSLDTMKAISVLLPDEPRFRTRDILHVILKDKKNESFHFFVNHWPSRIGGEEETDPKRMAASMALKTEIEKVLKDFPQAMIFVMGDFNDETTDASIKNLEGLLINTFSTLDSLEKGSYCYRDNWNMLDQILVSPSLTDKKSIDYIQGSATIFEKEWMKQKGEDNRYAGYPLRTWGGKLYLGGFSDHFPVYIQIR